MAGRSVPNSAQEIGGLRKQLDDHRSTTNARVTKRPTGTVEPTFAATAKSGTLMLEGQTVNRADYPLLWQWAQDNDAVAAGMFGSGNNSTTFTLPDMRNRVTTAGGIAAVNFLIWT